MLRTSSWSCLPFTLSPTRKCDYVVYQGEGQYMWVYRVCYMFRKLPQEQEFQFCDVSLFHDFVRLSVIHSLSPLTSKLFSPNNAIGLSFITFIFQR